MNNIKTVRDALIQSAKEISAETIANNKKAITIIDRLIADNPTPQDVLDAMYCGQGFSKNGERIKVSDVYNISKEEIADVNSYIKDIHELDPPIQKDGDVAAALIVSDADIEAVWGNANFGSNTDKREIILDTLFKYARGYSTGSTATNICQDLGLIKNYRTGEDVVWTEKGEEYIRALAQQQPDAELLGALKYAHSQMQPFCDDTIVKQAISRAEQKGGV